MSSLCGATGLRATSQYPLSCNGGLTKGKACLTLMAHYRVTVRGDAHELSACSPRRESQNIASSEEPTEHLTVRLSADSPENA
jgi:hypothetical protein